MPNRPRALLVRFLRWSERYTKTDMLYLAQGGFWLALGQAVLTLTSFFVAVAFGHLASKDTYGNYKYILTLSSLLGAISLSGLSTSLTQSAAKGYDGSLRQGFNLNLVWSAGMVVIALGLGGYYGLVQHNEFLALSLLLVALFSPLLNGFSLFSAYLIGKKEFRLDTVFNIIDGIIPALLLIATLFVNTRAIILLCVYFAANTIVAGFFYIRSLRIAKNNAADPDMLSYSVHLSLMNIIGTVADKIDSIIIFAFLGPVQLGVYSYAIAIPEQIKALVKSIVPLSMPKFAQRPLREIKRTIWPRLGLFAGALFVTFALYILIAPLVFKYLFPVYVESVWYSQIYTLSLMLGLSAPLLSALQAHKKTRELYIISNVSAVALIVILPILTYNYGILGAILSQITYRGINLVLSLVLFWKVRD